MQAMLTPWGRIDGLGWVKHDEDENLENALNALAYPESHTGILHRQVISMHSQSSQHLAPEAEEAVERAEAPAISVSGHF